MKSKKQQPSLDQKSFATRLFKVEQRLNSIEATVEKHDAHLLDMEKSLKAIGESQSETHILIVNSKEVIDTLDSEVKAFMTSQSAKDEERTKEYIRLTAEANKYPKLLYIGIGIAVGLLTATFLFAILLVATMLTGVGN
mgnify:CR=1 FL=1